MERNVGIQWCGVEMETKERRWLVYVQERVKESGRAGQDQERESRRVRVVKMIQTQPRDQEEKQKQSTRHFSRVPKWPLRTRRFRQTAIQATSARQDGL